MDMKFLRKFNESSSSKFKLGLDIHGVIDSIPSIFSFLSDSIIKNGGEVHLITGGSWTEDLEKEINSYNIKYTHVFSVYDYINSMGFERLGRVQFPDGKIQSKFDDEVWNKVKGDYCKDNGITLHIDDTIVYKDHFSTPFARFWSHSGQKKESGKDI